MLQPLLWLKDDVPTRALISAWNELRHLLTPRVDAERGPVIAAGSAANALARSVLAAISEWRRNDRRELLALFGSEQDVVETCAKLIETDLDLPDGTLKRLDDD